MKNFQISPEARNSILQLEEDHFHDVKAKEIKPAKLSESVSAFANAAGGEMPFFTAITAWRQTSKFAYSTIESR
jgi:hypothetical protein